MSKRVSAHILFLLFAVSAGTGVFAQENVLLRKADSLRLAYDFPASVVLLQRAVGTIDSARRFQVEAQMITAQNGLNMMDYCSQPTVVARRVFPLRDFFLFYPLPDKSWRRTPNQLDSLTGGGIPAAIYFPDGAEEIYYSAGDRQGIRNMYRTRFADSAWTLPVLINEQVTSTSDEIFPMRSPDGKSLYFASRGLYGMGGYDLYVSRWNQETQDWDVPENMGFPYSSPYDDFLFINTKDNRYSIFASNRSCSRDSVCIYVLEYDRMPVRKAVTDVGELRALAALAPGGDLSRIDNGSAVPGNLSTDPGTQKYMDQMKVVRMLRDSVARFGAALDGMRANLANASGEERRSLAEDIAGREALLPALKDSLGQAVGVLQGIEMEFLMKGVVIDSEKLQEQADREIVGASSAYTFSKNDFGPAFHLTVQKPEVVSDESFGILSEGRFAESERLPEGLVYQIQIFTLSRKASVRDLNGLSPVFEQRHRTGLHTYYAGLFKTYKDALSNLSTVRNKGFRDAIIVAFRSGKPVGIPEARKLESQVRASYLVKIYPEDGQSLPESVVSIIHAHSDRDLIKSAVGGSVVFMAGPFEDRDEAQRLSDALKAAGVSSLAVEKSETDSGS